MRSTGELSVWHVEVHIIVVGGRDGVDVGGEVINFPGEGFNLFQEGLDKIFQGSALAIPGSEVLLEVEDGGSMGVLDFVQSVVNTIEVVTDVIGVVCP